VLMTACHLADEAVVRALGNIQRPMRPSKQLRHLRVGEAADARLPRSEFGEDVTAMSYEDGHGEIREGRAPGM